MRNAQSGGVSLWLFAAIFVCGVHQAYPATKGQRVRSSPDIPVTQFSCTDRPPGYYADVETGCQVYHMCTEGGNQFSYKCPNTTLFQQRMLICAHWYQVNCSRSEQHFGANLLIGQKDKPFVNDDPALKSHGKQVKTLQNPDTLQNLGHSARKGSERQAKSQTNNKDVQSNKVFQNNFKQNVFIPSTGFAARTTNSAFDNTFPTTDSPSRRFSGNPDDLSSLPLAGSVLPGGLRSFQRTQPPGGFTFKSQTFPSTILPQSSTVRPQFEFSTFRTTQRVSQPVQFTPTSTRNSIDRINLFTTTSPPVSFRTNSFPVNSNTFQPSGFTKPPQFSSESDLKKDFPEQPDLEFLPPSDQKSFDLAVASQENAVSSRKSTSTTTTSQPDFEIGGVDLPETDVKAEIEHTKNGSLPDDKYNTFLKRFNPYEEAPTTETKAGSEQPEPEQEHHVFINRFVPDFGPSAIENNLKDNPDNYVFINRFVLTPEEVKREKDRQKVDKLHNLLPPDDHVSVDFPGFDLTPPVDDSDNSESNKIELHLQDPRRTLFIPDLREDEFSKADAAPIVVTIPLHTHQKSRPMWFKNNESDDPCSRCHPSFIVNKDTCMPCVIIR